MKYVFALGLLAVIAAIVVAVVNGVRTRSAKSDWLDELDEIRMSSLGDDQEVTGALHAVPAEVALAPDSPIADEPSHEMIPDSSEIDAEAQPVSLGVDSHESLVEEFLPSPRIEAATVEPVERDDDGTVFREYTWGESFLLRVEATDPQDLRVIVSADNANENCAVDLPRGSLWHRGPHHSTFSVRTSNGWIQGHGTCAVAVDSNWTFAMCLEGEMNLRRDDTSTVEVAAGSIARMGHDDAPVQVMDTGLDALEDQDIVKRHRRLDTK